MKFTKLVKLVEQNRSLIFESDLPVEEGADSYEKMVMTWLKENKLDNLTYVTANSEAVEKEAVEEVFNAARTAKVCWNEKTMSAQILI